MKNFLTTGIDFIEFSLIVIFSVNNYSIIIYSSEFKKFKKFLLKKNFGWIVINCTKTELQNFCD